MNGEASSAFMKRVNACMSTVCPRMRNFISLAAATAESARALRARFLSAVVAFFFPVSAGAACATGIESAAAALRGGLICESEVSQVYCGNALLISYIRCDHRE